MLPLARLVAGGLGLAVAMTWPTPSPRTLAQPQASAASRQALAVIVNRRNPVEAISSGELRRIFLLETQQWPHRRRITVVHRDPGQAERAVALKLICNMGESDYQTHLIQEAFRGNTGGAMPRDIRSADGMRAFVFNAPGAIGYVRVHELDDTVKPLRIDGRLPTEPSYRLVEGRASARLMIAPLWAATRASCPGPLATLCSP